jgi:hypothetical protein
MITATPGGVEEVFQLIATNGDQLDLMTLGDKYKVRLIGPPLLSREMPKGANARKDVSAIPSKSDCEE